MSNQLLKEVCIEDVENGLSVIADLKQNSATQQNPCLGFPKCAKCSWLSLRTKLSNLYGGNPIGEP